MVPVTRTVRVAVPCPPQPCPPGSVPANGRGY